MNKSEYTELLNKVNEGGKVNQETYDEMVAYAKKAKTKRPPADAVLNTDEIKQAKVTKASGPKAPKAKAPKAKCSVTKEQDPKMKAKACPNESRAGGMCATHYSRLIYRAVPKNAEKAREASKNYAAKQRAAKKAAEKAETSSAA